ncbi:MAG TPA: glycosyl hydrolase [Sedimentisphaerales bacterium]|jgi:GH43 family beta-xylosidase|nr:glycosyl hydrolase [Sedimentisphaerales bacterium]HNU31295.1 glycosyl hydrolase [Sedimentisphaerales bacterium]
MTRQLQGLAWLVTIILLAWAIPVQASGETIYRNPILEGDLADPAVILHEGVYYLYATGQVDGDNGYRVYTSTNLIDWREGPVVFQPGQRHIWAPDVYRDPVSGKFFLYYTASQTIGVAEGKGPLGPFTIRRKLFDRAIDAHLFRDDDGKLYLYFVQFPGFRITVQPMSSPTEPAGEPKAILHPESDWETRAGRVTEGPWIIKHQSRYYLLYSGSGADTPDYAVGYAVADHPTGPFTRAPHNPIVHRSEGVFGPGHGCAIRDGAGHWWHIYHQKRNDRVEWDRFICIDPLRFDQDGNLFGTATRGTPQPAPVAIDRLAEGFARPPEQTRPWCYWYWISDNLSKEGITHDLEAMARVGIGEALIGNIFLEDVPAGRITVLSDEWWGLVEHAIREGGRVGVNLGMFNCPGWSQSGGPWIGPEQAMRYLASSETRVTGPRRMEQKLPEPKHPFQDVAVLAFPAPQNDSDLLSAQSPRVTCSPVAAGAASVIDGDPSTGFEFPEGAGTKDSPFTIEFEVAETFTARSLYVIPTNDSFNADCELQAARDDGSFQTVRRFKCDRSNMSPGVGFMPRGPVSVSFPATTARKFRLVFTDVHAGAKRASLAEISLSGAARLESFVEKQLGKMHPMPLPMWNTYLWPTPSEPDAAGLVVPHKNVVDLTSRLSADGALSWDVPSGEWVILRIGMTPTGMKNAPASSEGQGLEVDKMNRALANYHFQSFIGEVLKRIPASERKAFTQVVADSYEMGSQNWTDGFGRQFRECYGYDPTPWLPVLTGRLVGSADQSERFLWDLRRLVADRVATDYVGGLRDACRPHGLGLWLENYGHWGFPSEFLKYGAESDRIGGEYWVTGDLGSIECRAASSCANTYGKAFVSAESFTGGPAFQNAPRALKARGDWSFCEGVNHFVLHVCIHQPWEDRVPGVNAWFGTEFNRHNTWFEQSKEWIEYLRRSCWLLQQGFRVTDVAYFIGEDAPKMTGVREPALPPGRDFDYINAEVIEKTLAVKDGMLTLPHGTQYRVLVLPDLPTMRPEVLRKVRDLVNAGATVLGQPPLRSPSMENFPRCDDEVRSLAAELWGNENTEQPGERSVGKGRILWRKSLEDILASLGSKPDFESSAELRFTHRRVGEVDIYFVANPQASSRMTTAAFRAGDKAPELWWPNSGRIERPAVYDVTDGVVRLPLTFGPTGSVFVVFREKAAPKSQRIVSVCREGRELLGVKVAPAPRGSDSDSPNNFTFAVWVKPADDTTLVREANRGIVGMSEKRNDLVPAPHGDTFGGRGHAGSGLAIGRNGVCVFEHGADYFAPTLVHAAALTDWTHVAVVYRDGCPSLYLDGKLARTGLKSEHIVHSGVQSGGSAQFRGQAGAFARFARVLDEDEVAALARTMPRPDDVAGGPQIWLTRRGHECFAEVASAGEYELAFADGSSERVHVGEVPSPRTIAGPWNVHFSDKWDAPEQAVFENLKSWTEHSDRRIKYYSGPAVYGKTFEVPDSWISKGELRITLDLGDVKDLASVRVNGRDVGTLWLAPWRLDITDAVRRGENTLEVEVVNVWNNRLVGDAALPTEQQQTFLLSHTVNAQTPLLPAGLLGPVLVHATLDLAVRSR